MPLLLGLALLLGYAAGIGAGLLFLPRPVIAPHYQTLALVGAALAGGLGVLALLGRRRHARVGGGAGAEAGSSPTDVAAGAAVGTEESEAPAGADAPPAEPRPEPTGQAAPMPAMPTRLGPLELRHALQEGRLDVFVQPLVCLPPQLFAPYRALARLRAADGRHLEPAAYLPSAAACSLLGLIDQIFIVRAAHAVRQATAEGHEVRLFCALSPATLDDPEVLAEIADFLAEHAGLAERLVVEVDRVRLNRPSEQALARLRRLGLRLSLRRLMPDRLDARLLARRGISFVRLEQPPDATRSDGIGPDDELAALRRSLDDAGITLVLDQTDAEPILVELSDHPIGLDPGRGTRSSAA